MKKSTLILLLLLLMIWTCQSLFSAAVGEERMLSGQSHVAGNLILMQTNFGSINALQYPRWSDDSIPMLSKAAPWISAKRHRRDPEGQLLYWLHSMPTFDLNQTITQDDPLWTPNLKPVIDTLTTVGFDGDRDLYEFLPAYNPLIPENPLNAEDRVFLSVLGYPAPREFEYPDQEGSYLFSVPQDYEFNTPGLETLSAYYYDFCPFGTEEERDFGSARHLSEHYPLGLAMHQESYAWSLQSYANFVITKYTVYNCNELDELMDLTVSYFVDADIGGSENEIQAEDVSGYVMGAGYNFAYTRKGDNSTIQTPYMLANKLMTSAFDAQRQCWFWRVGDGPDDWHPTQLHPQYSPRQTPNEKYWLSSGRNPNYNKFISMIPQGGETEYEQPLPNDTRFLNVIHAAQPTSADPEPEGRFHLQPGEAFFFYSIMFVGDSIDDLKQASQFIEAFINSGYVLNDYLDATCIPYLYRSTAEAPANIRLDWHSYQTPDLFVLKYKADDAPDNEWQSINLPGDVYTFSLGDLSLGTNYQFKVGAFYENVYLESAVLEGYMDPTSTPEEPLPAVVQNLKCFPNPFNPSTNIAFSLSEPGDVSIQIFNTRGQRVRKLFDGALQAGDYVRSWDGTQDNGKELPSGLYFVRLKTRSGSSAVRTLMLK